MINRPGTPGASGGVNYLKVMKVVKQNLNKEIALVQNATVRGMINAAAFIRNETEKTEPLTPVDYGNLRASWFVTTAKGNPVGRGVSSFKGPKKDEIASNHVKGIADSQGELARMTTPTKKFVMMGYSTNYSGYVHEFIGNVKFKRKGSGAKWLQTHIGKNTGKIVQIIGETSQIKR